MKHWKLELHLSCFGTDESADLCLLHNWENKTKQNNPPSTCCHKVLAFSTYLVGCALCNIATDMNFIMHSYPAQPVGFPLQIQLGTVVWSSTKWDYYMRENSPFSRRAFKCLVVFFFFFFAKLCWWKEDTTSVLIICHAVRMVMKWQGRVSSYVWELLRN